ncbi:sialic acid-binding Ig-like lectin 5 isoform X2 [Prionailurus iriomotensis]
MLMGSNPTTLGDPALSPALTGDIEPGGSFHGGLNFWQFHLTGELGAMVLRPRGEGHHRGVQGLGVQRVQSSPHPGECERSSPFAGPRQAAGPQDQKQGMFRRPVPALRGGVRIPEPSPGAPAVPATRRVIVVCVLKGFPGWVERRVCKGKGEDRQSESRMSPCRGEATKEQRLSFDGHDEWDQMQNQGDDAATSEQELELIKERERAIRQLQAHTLDVRQRFKDLPVMIRDQGDPTDSTEADGEGPELSIECVRLSILMRPGLPEWKRPTSALEEGGV